MAHRVLVSDDLSADGVQILKAAGLNVDRIRERAAVAEQGRVRAAVGVTQ